MLPFRYFADPEFCCTFYDCSNSIPTRMQGPNLIGVLV